MLPYSPILFATATVALGIIPIMTTYPGVTLPPWVGLVLAGLSAGIGILLKQMAPAGDVHKDSELPAPPALPAIPTVGEIADELERRRQERVASRLHKVDEEVRG